MKNLVAVIRSKMTYNLQLCKKSTSGIETTWGLVDEAPCIVRGALLKLMKSSAYKNVRI